MFWGRVLIAGLLTLLLCAQSPIKRFPPGTFNNRAALDAAPASEGTVLIDVAAITGPQTPSSTTNTFPAPINLGSGPNGTANRALGVMLYLCGVIGGTSSNPAVTWDGVPMTNIGHVTDVVNGDIYFFGLTNPNTGSKNAVATWTTANQSVLALLSVVGADQTGSTTTFANLATGAGSSSVSTVSVTSPSTRITMAAFQNKFSAYTSVGSGNTNIGTQTTCALPFLAANYDTSHTNPTLSYSPSVTSWSAIGVSIKGI